MLSTKISTSARVGVFSSPLRRVTFTAEPDLTYSRSWKIFRKGNT